MNKKNILVAFLSIFFIFSPGISFAQDAVSDLKKMSAQTNSINPELVSKDAFIKSKLLSAESRFQQGNVKASYNDFLDIISKIEHDDYVFLAYVIKMSEYGFFDLAEKLITRLDDNLFTQNYATEIRKFYYPSAMLDSKDILSLSDAYAGIVYNNLAMETTSELKSSVKINESDYKNYLISLGYYKSNNLHKALKYINRAISENDMNVNYMTLKTKILADLGKSKQSLKVLDKLKKEQFLTTDFNNIIRSTEEYVLYKVSKDNILKDYHLAYYYHLQGKSSLAIKVLQSVILQAKDHTPNVFGLLAKIYYENNEPNKALETAQRAYREDSKNYFATLVIADINYDEKNFEEAFKYYKKASKLTKETAPKVGLAKTYLALDKDKKSKKLYEKLIQKQVNDVNLLISTMLIFPQRAYEYLPLVLSLDITNVEIWLELANLAIIDENIAAAETYLNNAYYIDENNFRYYYYLSQVLKEKGDNERSNRSLVKCSKLNSNYEADMNFIGQ